MTIWMINQRKGRKNTRDRKIKGRSNDCGIRIMICQKDPIEDECRAWEKNIRMRKRLVLQRYDYRVQDIPGKDNLVADYLSRIIDRFDFVQVLAC